MDEIELNDCKWFDYRPMSVYWADLKFLAAMNREYFAHQEKHGDTWLKCFLPKRGEKFEAWKHWNLINELRQFADSQGMRYDHFWEYAFKAFDALGFQRTNVKGKGGKLYQMVPVVAFRNKAILDRVMQLNDQYQDSFAVISEAQLFKVSNYQDLELQNEYFWYLVLAIQQKNAPDKWVEALSRAVKYHRIPRAFIERHFAPSQGKRKAK